MAFQRPLAARPFSSVNGKARVTKDSTLEIKDPVTQLVNASPEDLKEQKKHFRILYKDMMELTKFKLSLLNSVGAYSMFYFYAPLSGVGVMSSLIFLFATQTVAMSSQCFGQIAESKQDSMMVRTQNRPMVLGKFSGKTACFIGTGLTVSSLIAFSVFNPYTFLVSNAVWFSYLMVYLPMKQKSSTNTLVGAVVGALPPFIGTYAQMGQLLDLPTFLLATYIFSWQYPHFYGILYTNRDDYAKAGFKMISDEDPTGLTKAHKQMLYSNVLNTLLPVAMAHPSVGMLHPVFLVPFMFYQSKSFVALSQFKKEEASVNSAKEIKRTAYMPFMILLLGFFGTTAYNRFMERREKDKELYSVGV